MSGHLTLMILYCFGWMSFEALDDACELHEKVRVALKLCLQLLPPTLASARVVRYEAGGEWL